MISKTRPLVLKLSKTGPIGSGFRKLWKKSLAKIVAFMLRITSPRCAFLRKEGGNFINTPKPHFPNVPTPSCMGRAPRRAFAEVNVF